MSGLPGDGAPLDSAEQDAAWLALVGRTGEAHNNSPVYRMRLTGAIPQGLLAIPKDPRPPNRERGETILQGHWRFGAAHVETPPGHAPWGPPFPSLHFADRIHRFHWLRDVAAHGPEGQKRAKTLALSWIEQFGKWEAFAWRVSPTADRLINIISAGPWLLAGLEGEARTTVLDSLARQARHVLAGVEAETDPAARLRAAVALVISGAAMEEGQKRLEAGLALLEAECGMQIMADGGHISRSPEALSEALFDIQAVEDLMLRLGLQAPAWLARLQTRMASMLSFFTLPDGGLLAVNGGGDGAGGVSQAALAPYGAPPAKFSFSRLSGYQRVQADELTMYFDTGPAPEPRFASRAHAGSLAITVDDGTDRIVTACGAHADLDPAVRDAARRSAAHSVLSLEGEDSAMFLPCGATGVPAPEGPPALTARRLEENEQFLLEGQHGGWRVRHGLIYRRRLYIAKNGARITGEDSLSRPMAESLPAGAKPIPFALRFHLHPNVQIAQGPDNRTVFLGLARRQRVWRFRSEALLSIEISRYWGHGAAQKAQQLVIRGEADPAADGSQAPNRVRWALSRIEPEAAQPETSGAGEGIAASPGEAGP
jgi:uncharacterized heparinase superfamily protein